MFFSCTDVGLQCPTGAIAANVDMTQAQTMTTTVNPYDFLLQKRTCRALQPKSKSGEKDKKAKKSREELRAKEPDVNTFTLCRLAASVDWKVIRLKYVLNELPFRSVLRLLLFNSTNDF